MAVMFQVIKMSGGRPFTHATTMNVICENCEEPVRKDRAVTVDVFVVCRSCAVGYEDIENE